MALDKGLDVEARQLLRSLRDARFPEGLRCVRCESSSVQCWGRAHGRQRYRCRSCRRTFSDLTNTPFMYSKRLSSWLRYLACMEASETVRRSAVRAGVHTCTAFRWRHRLLGFARQGEAALLEGIVEVTTFRTTYSEKGTRRRVADGAPTVFVICARDRHGKSFAVPSYGDRVADFREVLSDKVRASSFVCTDGGRFSGAGRFARSFRGFELRCPRFLATDSADSSRAHVVNVVQEIRRTRTWLKHFRGVATKYLDNYLAWHQLLDRPAPRLIDGRFAAGGLGRFNTSCEHSGVPPTGECRT